MLYLQQKMIDKLKLLQLPNEVLEKILLNLSYDEIARNRIVCRKFNVTCGQLLNRGFLNVERRHSIILKKVKSLLPRRESERRVHNLSRHTDILTAIETRISMLRMSFMKYIELKACCFIPGKVIDETLRILSIVERTTAPPRTHEILQELRDISSMAMEYFDENIAPDFKIQRTISFPTNIPGPRIFSPPLPIIVAKDVFRKDLNLLQHRTSHQKKHIKMLTKTVEKLVMKVKKQNTVIRCQTAKIKEQFSKIRDQDSSIADLKRHVDEWDLKFADLVAELSRARDETSTKSNVTSTIAHKSRTIMTPSTVPTIPIFTLPPRLFKPNIKPRVAQIIPRSMATIEFPVFESERKRKLPVTSTYTPIPNKITRFQVQSSKIYDDEDEIKNFLRCHNENYSKLPPFLSSSLETLLKSPISSVKSRKRKSQ